jgi:serine/threonine-protein kinase
MINERLGTWVIDKEVGRGGMGRVYLAHEELSGRQGAVKVLSAELAQDPGFLHRFQREIDAVRQLDHPNIVRFYESGFENGMYFYAMEYVDGPSFLDLLHENGRLPWKEVLDAALQICLALKHAHDRGIIHRDLKPANLLRSPDGVVKLTDFGIAKVFASTHLTTAGGIVGTAEYLSPEQAAGKPVSKRSDLYSLGVVLYTLLTGRNPFEGENFLELLHKHRFAQFDRPQTVVPEVPYELDEVVCRLMEKDPANRPPDAMILHRYLDSVRRKLDRKTSMTMAGTDKNMTVAETESELSDQPGAATLMSRLVREELERQNRGSSLNQILNKPWVLVPLFLLCVGLIVKAFWFSGSDSPGPPPASASETEVVREAQRLYEQGLRLRKQGDVVAAHRVWANLITLFRDDPTAKSWVSQAAEGLNDLNKEMGDKERWLPVRARLEQARQWRNQGKRDKAELVWKAVEELYKDNPWAEDILNEVKEDRKK